MHNDHDTTDPMPFEVLNAQGSARVLLVCEHASAHMPDAYGYLGLPPEHRESHAAWDPGALGVAQEMARDLDAVLVAGTLSRLIYDLNRPPENPAAMPAKSEVIEVPGNADLSEAERERRISTIYTPYHRVVAEALAMQASPVLVTVHSFTPVYHGAPRRVEIGLLHDADSRIADLILENPATFGDHVVERNAPYGPADGVMHTLNVHGDANGHPNLMIEVRNDLIKTAEQQRLMGRLLAGWVSDALAKLSTDVAGAL